MRNFFTKKSIKIFTCLLATLCLLSLPAFSLTKGGTHKEGSNKLSHACKQVLANHKKKSNVKKAGINSSLNKTGSTNIVSSPKKVAQALKKVDQIKSVEKAQEKNATTNKISILDSPSLPAISSTQDYQFLLKWGSYGTTDGKFSNPMDVDADSAGNVFVADFYNHRIQKFDNNGGFIKSWGGQGSGNGKFYRPEGVCSDSAGNVFVADTQNQRMQKFDNDGNFKLKWNTWNSGNEWLTIPQDCAVDSADNVYVTNRFNERVVKFDNNGNYIAKWGSYGTGDGQFDTMAGIAIDSMDNIFVSDAWGHRVQKFDSDGNFLAKWGGQGSGSDKFYNPESVTVDTLDRVIVADTGNNRVQLFTNDGVYVRTIGTGGDTDGKFLFPYGVGADTMGNLFVADAGNERIQKFGSPTGNIGWNFSFEIDDNADGMPDRWNPFSFVAGDGRSEDFSKEGSYSLKMSGDSAKAKSAKQRITVSGSAGDEYTFSGWNKTDGATSAGRCVVVLLYLNNTDGTRTSGGYLFFGRDTHDWLQRTISVVANKDYSSIDITIGYFYQTGTTYFDDLRLIKQ